MVVVVDEWAAEGGDVVDGDEDDTVIVGSAAFSLHPLHV
jgi:hypothetical protein